jgi:hypothetical protein
VDIEIDGEIYYWPFVKYDDYYVNSWAIYGLDEELPEETSIGKKSETYLSKIYRLDDFLPMYYERYYDWYDYDDYYYDDEDYEDVE